MCVLNPTNLQNRWNLRNLWNLRKLWILVLVASVGFACGGADTAANSEAAPPPAAAATIVSGEGEWFVKTGCSKCHAVSAFGVTSEAQIGPDLSIAVEDVKTRFGVSIEEFLDTPSGTMALVLSSQIQLTPEQKQVAIQKLHAAYAAHQKSNGGVQASH